MQSHVVGVQVCVYGESCGGRVDMYAQSCGGHVYVCVCVDANGHFPKCIYLSTI